MPEHETTIRLGFFFGIFAVMACWELIAPCRRLTASKAQRWTRNLLIVAINTLTVRLLFPAAAVGLALVAAQQGWGLLNIIALPQGLEVFLAVVALDFAIYLQHVLFHAIPALWRLHMVHHSDVDIDVTTGARFHPVEIVLSILIKFAVILA
ncbi:MAG TPA: sterol desaturase family protein, partial [Chromatiales bacterium]|nr:sterol desaturase family protein [Chromatiales bacterium]